MAMSNEELGFLMSKFSIFGQLFLRHLKCAGYIDENEWDAGGAYFDNFFGDMFKTTSSEPESCWNEPMFNISIKCADTENASVGYASQESISRTETNCDPRKKTHVRTSTDPLFVIQSQDASWLMGGTALLFMALVFCFADSGSINAQLLSFR